MYPISLNYLYILKKTEVTVKYFFFSTAFQVHCFDMAVTGGNHGGVPSLESFASDVFLKQVIYKTTSKTVEAVREVIDQILIGKVKKSTR